MSDRGSCRRGFSWIGPLAAGNLLVVALVALYLGHAYQVAEDEARSRLGNLVSLVRLNLDSLVGKIDLALLTLAEGAVTGPDSEVRRLHMIDSIARDDPEFRTLVITDAEGAFVGGKLAPDGKPFSIAGRDYYDYLKNTPDKGMHVAGPVLGRSNGKWSLVFARRLNAEDGRFAGVVLSGYATERFAESFAPLDLDAFKTLAILKTDQTMLATFPDSPQHPVGRKRVSPEFLAALAVDPAQGFIPRLGGSSPDDPERMAAYVRTADERFHVAASMRLDQVFAAVHRQALAFLFLLALMLAASLYFARRTWLADQRLHEYQDHLEAMVDARTHELMIARDLAEAANRAKTSFLANMSHELRTPMNAIMGMTELVMLHLADARDRERLGKALKSAKHLLHLLNELLDTASIEAGRLVLAREEFAMASVLDQVQRLIAPAAAAKGLAFSIDAPPALAQARFIGDAARLGQILLHLGSNAVKFTATGRVDISARIEKETADSMQLSFAIRDTGIGIAPADQRQLFRLFAQVDASSTRKFGGTGLGLGLCKLLAEQMGGHVEVCSEVDAGSTFTLSLGLSKAAAAGAA